MRGRSVLATCALAAAAAIAACHDAVSPAIPPVTSALAPFGSGLAPPVPTSEPASAGDAGAASIVGLTTAAQAPINAMFVDAPGTIESPMCSRLLIAIAKGKVLAMGESLAVGDVLVVTHPEPIKLEGSGLALVARRDLDSAMCGAKARPVLDKKVVRASAAADLRWAGGAMSAHLDVGAKTSPDVYLGRLEGTVGVAEHTHPASWEILAAVEASGTFVLDGTEGHLGPRQIIIVPPGAKHAWKPDSASKLVAIQMYSPPGPEQRFVSLAAADKDAGARDAR